MSWYDVTSPVSRPYKPLQLSSSFLQNYNLTMIFIFVPLLTALIAFILSKTCLKSRKNLLTTIWQYGLGEYGFYSWMFSGYLMMVSLAMEVKYIGKGASMGGLMAGIFFFLMGVIYFVVLLKKP